MTQPTGVFVRLPLSDEQVLSVLDSYTGDKESTNAAMQKTILSIGTLVTAGDLQVAGWCHPEQLADLHIDNDSPESERFAVMSRVRIGSRDVPLVRQSDHLAKLAERDAEIARKDTQIKHYRVLLERILDKASKSCDRTLSEFDARLLARACSDAYEALKGTEA